jgi:N-methylhydantoinase B
MPVAAASAERIEPGEGERWNDNLTQVGAGSAGKLFCRYCGRSICAAGGDYLDHLAVIEGPPSEAGPQIFTRPDLFVDERIVFRQYCCPGCFTAFATEVVPESHPVRHDHVEID